jgi:UDP-glucose 4-epimerase
LSGLERIVADLKRKRVLVTGGAGFIGSHIVDLLCEEGCRAITVLDNMVRGRPENLKAAMARGPVRLVDSDIRDGRLLASLVEAADIVFHQAALRITHCAAEPWLAMQVMVQSTFDLLELCVKHRVEKVIAASSASVYGMADAFATTEDHHPYNNRTFYGAAKAFNEGLLRSFNETNGLDYVALRYFNVYGPRMDIHGRYTEVLIRWMERLDAGQAPIIFGDGQQTMDFVHVRDVARANILGARANASDEAFNIASGEETSLSQLARSLAAAMGRPGLAPEFAAERSVNPVPRRLAATAKAERSLRFRAAIPLQEGLRELVDWWRFERRRPPQAAVLGAAGS